MFYFSLLLFEHPRPAGSMRPPCLIYLSTSTDCESGTRPIFIKPGSMEAGKNVLTRGTCFVTCRYEGVADAGLLWISRCVLGAAGFRVLFSFFFIERPRPSASMRPFCFIYLSTPTSSLYDGMTRQYCSLDHGFFPLLHAIPGFKPLPS